MIYQNKWSTRVNYKGLFRSIDHAAPRHIINKGVKGINIKEISSSESGILLAAAMSGTLISMDLGITSRQK